MRHFRKILALLLVLATIASIVPWGISASAASDYLTLEEAALQIREHIKNRVENYTIRIRSTDSWGVRVFDTAWSLALAHTGDPKEGDYMAWQHGRTKATHTYYTSGGQIYYTFTVAAPYYTTLQQEQELDLAVDALLEQLNVWDKSDYEKICAVYDYICQNVVYDDVHANDDSYTLKNTAYAALIHKTAVCQGYVTLFYRLLLPSKQAAHPSATLSPPPLPVSTPSPRTPAVLTPAAICTIPSGPNTGPTTMPAPIGISGSSPR